MRGFSLIILAACGSSASTNLDASARGADAANHAVDAPRGASDAPMGSIDAPVSNASDGTPTRQACTNSFGNAIGSSYGRLDGYLVAIVPPGSSGCNADSSHIHLQIKANGEVYDVAVNVGSASQADVHTETKDLAFPAWSEGWHGGEMEDYVQLGIHSTDAPSESPSTIEQAVDSDLQTANHITVFATPYSSSGAHLVHRSTSSPGRYDGILITQPLSSPAHARFFWFDSESF